MRVDYSYRQVVCGIDGLFPVRNAEQSDRSQVIGITNCPEVVAGSVNFWTIDALYGHAGRLKSYLRKYEEDLMELLHENREEFITICLHWITCSSQTDFFHVCFIL